MSFKLSALLNPASEPNSPKRTNTTPPQIPPTQEKPTYAPPEPQREIFRDDQVNNWGGFVPRGSSPRDGYYNERASPSTMRNDQYGQLPPYPQARRSSSYGSAAAPVEPYSIEALQMPVRSPTLEQYHHRARSPEEQRRLSYMSMSSNPPVLPPIQNFGDLERRLSDQAHSHSQSQSQHEHTYAYGQDASQVIAQPAIGSQPAEVPQSPNSIAQNREPDYVRNEPVTTQIRAPSPPPPSTDNTGASPLTHTTPQVKLEPTAPSREPTPAQAQAMAKTDKVENPTLDTDTETLKALAQAKNEHGLRNASRELNSAAAAPAPSAPVMSDTSSPSAPRKRKPVDSKVRKGGAKKPPQGKKRKAEDSGEGQPSRTPSTKPAPRSKGKKSSDGTPITGSSPAPVPSSPGTHVDDAEEDESGSDDGIYCICRKGDNHTWMIACDGSCDEWYHGKCVDVKEADGDLIEQYFCPSCTAAGEGRTTWKRMCRRQGCRAPARRDERSKYCSDECGILFMQETFGHLPGGDSIGQSENKRRRDRRKANMTDNFSNEMEQSEDDGRAGPRGGVMSISDLKAMASAAKDVEHFKSLGNSLLSPPATASPSSPTFERDLKDDAALSPPDAARVAAIKTEVADLKKRFELLKERERFVAMTKEQAARLAESEGVKVKDICAYDPRLAWSEAEFALWRDSAKGKACFAQGSLNAEPTSNDVDVEMTDANDAPAQVNGTAAPGVGESGSGGVKKEDDADTVLDSDGDVDLIKHPTSTSQPNGTKTDDQPYPSPTDPPPSVAQAPAKPSSARSRAALLRSLLTPPELCPRKRCTRHTQWAKIAHYDVQFELALCRQQTGELGAEEREIRERAVVGWRKDGKRAEASQGLVNGDGIEQGAEKRDKDSPREDEGWVEVLG
ncbi:hypothetical protein HDK64DRAFT_264438 [Phyllosticta capitalensis]